MFRRTLRAQSAMSDSMLQSSKKAAVRGGNTRGSAAAVGMGRRIGRTSSAPSVRRTKMSGVMKFVTADDSLHNKYGESSKHKKQSPEEGTSRKRTISFKHIEIREYNRTVGDNPSCSSGPPITIAWEFNPHTKIISVDQYEESRPQRRTHFEMILPRDLRQKMLRKEWDVTQSQIAAAVRQNIKVKNQRRQTVQNLGKSSSKMEEALENASRSVFRGLMGKGNTDKEVAKLEKQMKQAEMTRKQAELESEMAGEYAEDNDTFELEQDLEAEEDEKIPAEEEVVAALSPVDVKQSPPRVGNEQKARQTPPHTPPRSSQLNPTVEETYEQEEKKQELQHIPIPVLQPSPPHQSPAARPVVVIEESDSEEEEQKPSAHRPANPQETTHIAEEEKKTPIVLVPATKTKPSSSTPLQQDEQPRSSTPLKNSVISPAPPAQEARPKPVVPLTNGKHVSQSGSAASSAPVKKEIPPVARVSDEDDSEDEYIEV